MINKSDQSLINIVVEGTLSGTLSDAQEGEYISMSSPYDDLYTDQEISLHEWIQDGTQPLRQELSGWESYFDEEWMLDIGFTETQLSLWSKGSEPTLEEYKIFLREWIKHTFKNFNYANHPIASLHVLQHADGPQCICMLSSTEGGQGGWEFEDVYQGLFKTADDAVGHLKEKGIVEGYSEKDIDAFIRRVTVK